jgi:hypothetical protein
MRSTVLAEVTVAAVEHGRGTSGRSPGNTLIDHIVLAVPDLADGAAGFAGLTGVRPTRGGRHADLGTANFLVGLGVGAYLEVIGPDPDRPDPGRPRPFGIDDLTGPLWGSRTRPRRLTSGFRLRVRTG